jgi:hypothetical protein
VAQYTHVDPFEEKIKFGFYLVTFSLFLGPKNSFPHFYFGLRILLPSQIQWKENENPKNPKIDFPYTAYN